MTDLKRNLCIVTGTRAEYGLLRPLLKRIDASSSFNLQLVVTGSHLCSDFGYTVNNIISDGFTVNKKIDILLNSDTAVGITKSMGVFLINFSDVLRDLEPDLLLLVGDRYEILAAASCALIAGIPVAHCHGGEITEGAIDDAIRHSVSKMSNVHFCSSELSRSRLIQLGEQPSCVHAVGPLALSTISETPLLPLEDLEASLDLSWAKRNLVVTFHPETLEPKSTLEHLNFLLGALDTLQFTNLIFTLSNTDTLGRTFNKTIVDFCYSRANAFAYPSLGQTRYYSCLKYCDAVVGNSSSGLLEAPLFSTPTLNIGNRQKGRETSSTVINCSPSYDSIVEGLQKVLSLSSKISLSAKSSTDTVFSDPSKLILDYLLRLNYSDLRQKQFYDCFVPP